MFLTSISYIMPLFIPSHTHKLHFHHMIFMCIVSCEKIKLVLVVIDIMYTWINLTELHTKSETNQIDMI